MQNSLIVASFAAALAALTASIAPGKAEPIANAYPYCLFGRGGGSTTCYFRTRAECGNGCVNNPNYVGDERARTMLAGSGLAPDASRTKVRPNGDRKTLTMKMPIGAIDSGARASVARDSDARASVSRDDDFAGWPTDYLVNRFGDHQAQGRF
jgi:hypothetical protein